jgi:hypothetical protein
LARVLLGAILDDVAPVPYLAEVAINSVNESATAVSHLSRYRPRRHGLAVIDGLQSRRAVRVTKGIRSYFPRLPLADRTNVIESFSEVAHHPSAAVAWKE